MLKPVFNENNVGFENANATPRISAHTRSTKLSQRLTYLLLFSAAATLSTLLPTPWSFRDASYTLKASLQDPASEWKDNVWPLRPPTPWDISTDYPYNRSLEYDVQEGTWLRLDVHPATGDIV